MTVSIGVAYAELKKQQKEFQTKLTAVNKAMDSLRTVCDHKYKLDYTCGHKGENYYICEYCENTY